MPDVSVIITAHNEESTIAEAIDSVLAQTFSNWELCIVNDGSSDRTGEIIESYSERFPQIFFVNQQQLGLSAARNVGLSATTGSLVQFLDADDKLLPEKLQNQVSFMQGNKNVAATYGLGRYFKNNQEVEVEYPLPEGTLLSTLLVRNFILINAALIKREVLNEVGGFKESSSSLFSIYGCEDWDFWLRLAIRGFQIECQNEIVVHNRWTGRNMSEDVLRMKRSYAWVLDETLCDTQYLGPVRYVLWRMQRCYRFLDYLLSFSLEKTGSDTLAETDLVLRGKWGWCERSLFGAFSHSLRQANYFEIQRIFWQNLARVIGKSYKPIARFL
ncbi:MAG: hypothetical protein CMH60_00200 [Myxococcales bacterium]|nr:hypothetical protein [Myxococcales bacterium]|tara:strand:- start:94 stop:1080 length:987 start_codon:yes stop_codon:yes gene_type:complete